MLARDLSDSRNGAPTLTARQIEVLKLVAGGHSNREIATLLHVSENGIKAHIARLLVRFGVPNRAALVRVALPDDGGASGSVMYVADEYTVFKSPACMAETRVCTAASTPVGGDPGETDMRVRQ